jgi:hypothetical protein
MPGPDRDRGRYDEEELPEARCPGCGNEDGNTQTVATNAQPVPFDSRAGCPECDHRGSPLEFHHEYKWERMSDEERREAEEAAEREAGRMAEHQYSAAYISEAREP